MSAVHAWPLPEVTSTTVHIKFVPPVSRPAVDGRQKHIQEVATHASTSVVFAPGRRRCTLTQLASSAGSLDLLDLCEIIKCTHLKFMVSGRSKQA